MVQISRAADGGAKVCLPWNYLRIIWTAWQMFEPHAPPFVEGLKQLFFLDSCHSRASWDALVGWNLCDVNAAGCSELKARTIKLLTVILLCVSMRQRKHFAVYISGAFTPWEAINEDVFSSWNIFSFHFIYCIFFIIAFCYFQTVVKCIFWW